MLNDPSAPGKERHDPRLQLAPEVATPKHQEDEDEN